MNDKFIVQTASDAILDNDAKLMRGIQKTLGTVDKGIKKNKQTDWLIWTV